MLELSLKVWLKNIIAFAIVLSVGWVANSGPLALAQEAATPAGKRPRPETTREFLGLGAAPDSAAGARGGILYGANCAFCHGAKANGAEGPDLVRSALVLHDEKGESIGLVVHGGRAEKGMPAFPNFTDAQLYELAEFLHVRVELTANRGTYQVQNAVTGNAGAGAAYFKGVGGCGGCHSVTGDLAHIGTKMQPADLQQAFLYPGVRGPGKVTVTLASGETVSGTLKRTDDFNVSLIDDAGVYRSYNVGAGVKVEVEDKLVRHRQLLEQYSDEDMHNLTAYLVTLK